MASSPTALTMAWLRDLGWYPWKAEYWCSFSKKRKDLYQCIDIVACKEQMCVGIQATTLDHRGARRNKILGLKPAFAWVQANELWLVCWRKILNDKGRKVWAPVVDEFSVEDFLKTGEQENEKQDGQKAV
jgi:hypothetical protein